MRLTCRRGLVVAVADLAPGSVLSVPAFGVAGGAPASAGKFDFVVDVKVGEAVRGCSGALIDSEWTVTAKSCFAEGAAQVPVGPPVYPTTVTVGRGDLTTTVEGQVRTVTEVVPPVQRDLLLANLDSPVIDVAPVKLAETAPVVGEAVQVAARRYDGSAAGLRSGPTPRLGRRGGPPLSTSRSSTGTGSPRACSRLGSNTASQSGS
jgi:Trypsin